MAKLTRTQAIAAYQSAYGKKPAETFLKYWVGKEDAVLRDKLIADPNAHGVYDQKRTEANKPVDPYAGLPDEYKSVLDQIKNVLDETVKRGQVVNPAIEITPEKTAEFLKQAEGEIDPYYAGQVKLAREGFLESVGYDKQSVANFERKLESTFKQGFKQIGSGAADVGFAQSGQRNQQEQQLVGETQQSIDEQRRALQGRAGELSRAFAQQYAGAPGYTAPTAGMYEAPKVSDAGFSTSSVERPLYTLSPDIYDQLIGTEEYNRRAAKKSRASELESAFRESEAIKQQRALTI